MSQGILGLYKSRLHTGSAGSELVGLAYAAEDHLVGGRMRAAREALSGAEDLLEDLGAVREWDQSEASEGGEGAGATQPGTNG